MKLSVIIVNYNVRYFLEQALLSVRAAMKGMEGEVFVVDNNSKDSSVAMVREKFPEVYLIENKDNPGFSKANNQAIKKAKGEYILLLNPDTVVEEDTFKKCVSFMEAHPDAGGLGIRMIDGSGTFLPESKRGFPSPWVAFCKTFGLSKLFPKSPLFNRYHLGFLDEKENHEIDVLAGAFMMMPRKVLDEIGLLDESFFMYGEDIDLSFRIVKAGYKNYYFADSTIIHYKGESTRKGSLNYVKVFYQAMIIFAKKHFTGTSASMYILLLKFAIYFRAILTLAGNVVKKLTLPILDALGIVMGLLFLKNFWASYRFGNQDYFEHPEIYFFNIPIYVLIWMIAIYLNGAYDRNSGIRNVLRGVLFGTLVLAAVYGFLPMEYRFSRAIILLGAGWVSIYTLGLRLIRHFIQHKNFRLGEAKIKNLIVVGTQDESERVLKLLQLAEVKNNFIGTVSPTESEPSEQVLGGINELDDIVHLFRIDEVIFCSANVSSQQIMHWMTVLGAQIEFKILPKESFSIIGSSSKNMPGELYTVDIAFDIDAPANRRNKRTIDILFSVVLLITLPLWILFVGQRWNAFKNLFKVLFKSKTWVSYSQNGRSLEDLPALDPGVLTPLDGLNLTQLEVPTIQRLNFLYAKDYTVGRDLEIIWKGFKMIGR